VALGTWHQPRPRRDAHLPDPSGGTRCGTRTAAPSLSEYYPLSERVSLMSKSQQRNEMNGDEILGGHRVVQTETAAQDRRAGRISPAQLSVDRTAPEAARMDA